MGGGEGEVTLESLTVAWRQEDQALLSPVWQGLGLQQEILHPGALTKELEEGNPPEGSLRCVWPLCPHHPGWLYQLQGQCCRDGGLPSPFSP